MKLDYVELDDFVHQIVMDAKDSGLTREQINASLIENLKQKIAPQILASLDRLIDKKKITDDRDCSQGRPYIYTAIPIKRRF